MGCPPAQDASHHQDYSVFSRGSQPNLHLPLASWEGGQPNPQWNLQSGTVLVTFGSHPPGYFCEVADGKQNHRFFLSPESCPTLVSKKSYAKKKWAPKIMGHPTCQNNPSIIRSLKILGHSPNNPQSLTATCFRCFIFGWCHVSLPFTKKINGV